MTKPWNDLEHLGRTLRRSIDMLSRKLNYDAENMEIQDMVALSNSIFYGIKVTESLVKTHDIAGRIERLEEVAHLVQQHENIENFFLDS